MFKKLLIAMIGLFAVVASTPAGGGQSASEVPLLSTNHQLAFPTGYREWVFLSAGLGMTYGPNAPAPGRPQAFTNVFVNPSSYRAFLKNGAWPDRTMFVLEIRGSASEGSINRAGHFQTDVRAIEANVKDARLPGGWGFYDFGAAPVATSLLPQSASCYTCHATNTAVEHTFVQFYPELMEVARRMKTINATYHDELPH